MAKSPYIAITLFKFTSDAPDHVPLYREDTTLVYAESEEEARELAEVNFRSDEGSYKNEAGDSITVTPTAIIDVTASLTSDLSEGGDLYSRHFRDFEAYSKWETLLDD
ncbi:DUF4288 domain-containing protein [Nocardia jinanensis]|uniref:DUF4288 domain-containing protein n=1 Tax=Nocardia jinanensis TaxID=382504 RepID=A0A917RVN1_9NOCA|nr:DUF4288 domain-containing protein [Nocardia jinanensis]GGL32762.1 hypothetical protein GCM10011588_54510 [Nocardia jinanensis]